MQHDQHAAELANANLGTLAIIAHDAEGTTLAVRERDGWTVLSHQPAATPTTMSEDDLTERGATALPVGAPANAEMLDAATDRAVFATTDGRVVYQKAFSSWWRLTSTWIGECSAVPVADILRDDVHLRWEPADR